jgi:hypothetical protein
MDAEIMKILSGTGEQAFETMVEQMKTNPEAIEALYG